ncbi:MAG: GNAT family N-acetyltransferase [Deltaproteobacteria bacterium]|nr:GNAT family N-acetyltransferase [Deltaproteobacteria bacterium]
MVALAVEPTYRVATLRDHAVVVALLCELIDELGPIESADRIKPLLDGDIRAALRSPQVRIFLAEIGGEVVGLGRADVLVTDPIFRLRDDHRCGYVDQMYVRPLYRAQGVGGELLRRCEDWFREQGIAHSLLHSAPRATRFYARQGYQPNREMFKRL